MSDATVIALLKQTTEWHGVRLVKLEVAQDANAQKQAIIPSVVKQVRDHEVRMRAVERVNFKLAGAMGAFCFIGTLAAQLLLKFVH